MGGGMIRVMGAGGTTVALICTCLPEEGERFTLYARRHDDASLAMVMRMMLNHIDAHENIEPR